MKQLSTVICSILFVIAGTMIIGMKDKSASLPLPGAMQTYAKPQPFSSNGLNLPLDVQLDLDKRTKHDTIYMDRVDTVYKTKIHKVVVPSVVEKIDTLYVPIFYLATPLEHKAESTEIVIVEGVHSNDSTEINHAGESEVE